MAKLYTEKHFIKNEPEPREETVKFLLDYSKALSVVNCNRLKFETLLN